MRNFFLKTIYQKRFMTIWWLIGIFAMTLLTVAFYHSFRHTDITATFKSLPPAVQRIVGDASGFTTVDGYLREQIFGLRIPLLLIILSISLFIGLTAGDEQKGLMETHLTLPVSRSSLLWQKLAAALVIITVASLGIIAGIMLALALLHESFPVVTVCKYTLNAVVISVAYGLVGFMLAALTGRKGVAMGLSSGFAFLSYIIHSMAPSVTALGTIDKLTFFHYYQDRPFQWNYFFILVIAATILALISIVGFQRRDIKTS